jgi:hypothetical protein
MRGGAASSAADAAATADDRGGCNIAAVVAAAVRPVSARKRRENMSVKCKNRPRLQLDRTCLAGGARGSSVHFVCANKG